MSVQTVPWGTFVWGPTLTTQPGAQPARTSLLSQPDFLEDWANVLATPRLLVPCPSQVHGVSVRSTTPGCRLRRQQWGCSTHAVLPTQETLVSRQSLYTGKGFSEPRGLVRWTAPTLQVTCPPLGSGVLWSTS